MKWSAEEQRFSVVRFCWANSIGPGQPGGYSAVISLSLQPRFFHCRRYEGDAEITLFGIRLHYLKDYDRWLS